MRSYRRRAVAAVALGGAAVAAVVAPAGTAGAQSSPRVSQSWSSVNGVSCPSTSDCMIVGTTTSNTPEAAVTTDGGKRWTHLKLPNAAVVGLSGVHCTGTKTCYALGDSSGSSGGLLFVTTDFGAAWTTHSLPTVGALTFSSPAAVGCITGSTCFVVGQASDSVLGIVSGVIVEAVTSGTGGSTVTFTNVTPNTISTTTLNAIQCPTKTECITVGQAVNNADGPQGYFMNGKPSVWTGYLNHIKTKTLSGVSCLPAAPTKCYISGAPASGIGSGASLGVLPAAFTASTSYLAAKLPTKGGPQGVFAVSCLKTCIGVGYTGQKSSIVGQNRSTWVTQKAPKNSGAIYNISCAASGTKALCVAVGQNTIKNGGQVELSSNPTLTSPTWTLVAPPT
jgi:hypothetical protein